MNGKRKSILLSVAAFLTGVAITALFAFVLAGQKGASVKPSGPAGAGADASAAAADTDVDFAKAFPSWNPESAARAR